MGIPVKPPLPSIFVHQRAKNIPTVKKISRGQDPHYVSVCTKSVGFIYFLRPWMQKDYFDLFLAVKKVKVSRLEWNSTRLVSLPTRCIYQVWNRYIKTCRKKLGKLRKNPKHNKYNRQNSNYIFFAKIGTYVEQYRAGHLCTKFERFILICEAMIAKKCVSPTFGCKVCQSDPIDMKIKLDILCHIRNVYAKFQTDIPRHVEISPENSDRRMDGRTLPLHNTTLFQTSI